MEIIRSCLPSVGNSLSRKATEFKRVKRPVLESKRCDVISKFCPEGAVFKVDGKCFIDYDYCKGCGICSRIVQVVRMEDEKVS